MSSKASRSVQNVAEAGAFAFMKCAAVWGLAVVAAGIGNCAQPDSSTASYDAATQRLTASSETHESVLLHGDARWVHKEWNLAQRQLCSTDQKIMIEMPIAIAPVRRDRNADWTGTVHECRAIMPGDVPDIRAALQKAAPHLPEAKSASALQHKLGL